MHIYCQCCKVLGIKPNTHALFCVPSKASTDRQANLISFHTHVWCWSNFSLTQTSLTGIVTHEPKCPAFMNMGLLDYIIQLVVCKDEVSMTKLTVHLLFSCHHLSRPSTYMIVAAFATSLSSASPHSWRRISHTVTPFAKRSFGMWMLQRGGSHQRSCLCLTHGPLLQVTHTSHSWLII